MPSRKPAGSRVAMAWGLLVASALGGPPVALAQYTAEAGEAEQGDHIRYFGSVKDVDGALVQDATLILTNGSSSYVFVTDRLGRFRGHLSLDAVAGKVTVRCFKADFAPVRVSKRAGPAGAKRTVQVDCVLRAAPTSAPAG